MSSLATSTVEEGVEATVNTDTVSSNDEGNKTTVKEFELFGSDEEGTEEAVVESEDAPAPKVPEQDTYVSMKGLYHGLGELSLMDIPKRKELFDILVRDHPVKKGKAASTSERIETNNKASTLVYGEISFNSFAVAMEKVKNKYGGLSKPGGIFYDIGAGTGKPALAAALLHDFDEVRGELSDALSDDVSCRVEVRSVPIRAVVCRAEFTHVPCPVVL